MFNTLIKHFWKSWKSNQQQELVKIRSSLQVIIIIKTQILPQVEKPHKVSVDAI